MSDEARIMQIFSDESGYGADIRIGALAKIVGEKQFQKDLNQKLSEILSRYKIEELKFKSINNNWKVAAAKEFIDEALSGVLKNVIGIHVLVWDKQDTRHSIQGRCDIANLCRMYFHNLKSINRQWTINAIWEFYPDEFSAINWHKDVVMYLNDRPLRKVAHLESDLFGFYKDLRLSYTKVIELSSKKYPILQLADLFTGLCRTSRQEHLSYASWIKSQSKQNELFESNEKIAISNTLKYKFQVKRYFKEQATKFKLGVNVSKDGYLQTFKQSRRLSIWHYTPQGEFDKAPTARF